MPVELTDNIAPTGDSGGTPATFSTHLDVYGNGGYRSVADQDERLGVTGLLTQLRRKLGMAVYQRDNQKLYILTSNPNSLTTSNSNWTEFSGGGGDMQAVFNASTPNVGAADYTKSLSLAAHEVTLIANNDSRVGADPATDSGELTLISINRAGGHHNTPTWLRLKGGQFGAGEFNLFGVSGQSSAPAVGDILVIDTIDNIGQTKLQFAKPSSLSVSMQNVFDNSTPEVAAATDSKRLTLQASDINLVAFSTSNAPAGSEGKVSIMALKSHQAIGPFPATLSLEGGEHVTKASLKIGGIGKIYGSSAFQKAEVGDVLVAETVSQAGEVDLKFSTPLPRLNQGWSPIPISQGNIPITITGGDSLAFAVQNICDIAAGQFTVARIFGNLPRLCKINVAVYTGSLTFQGGTSLVYFGSAQVNATAGQPNSYENNIFFVEEPVGTSNNWTPVAGTPVITIIEIDNSNGQDASGNSEDAFILGQQAFNTTAANRFVKTLAFQVPPPSNRTSIFTTSNTELGSQINYILNYGSIASSSLRVCQHFDPFKIP